MYKKIVVFTLLSLLYMVGVVKITDQFAGMYNIPSGSMFPQLLIDDQVIVKNINLHASELDYGDILVFKYDKQKDDRKMIKRAIGLPNDTIEMRRNGHNYRGMDLYINGVKILSEEINNNAINPYFFENAEKNFGHNDFKFFKETLPNGLTFVTAYANLNSYKPNVIEKYLLKEFSYTLNNEQYFFLGDNRNNSSDSRMYGFTSLENIEKDFQRILFNNKFLIDNEQRFFNIKDRNDLLFN